MTQLAVANDLQRGKGENHVTDYYAYKIFNNNE